MALSSWWRWVVMHMKTSKCSQVDEAEEFLFAATTTGDVVKVRLNKSSAPGEYLSLSVPLPRLPPPVPLPRLPTPVPPLRLSSFTSS